MISSLDDGVGAILEALEKHGISDDTLVWFFSDNGGVGVGDNRPLRGAKGSVFEGGIRVTAALRWPARVPAGRRVTAPLAYIDVLPTLMQIVGVEDHAGKPLDGIAALDLLTGSEREITRELYSYIGHGGEATEQITLIEPEWKLIVIGPRITNPAATQDREVHLFRITSDPYEKKDVASENPIVVHRMLAKLREFRALQPADAVPPYSERDPAFKAPSEWRMPDRETYGGEGSQP
jgi:arylsulfatase A-like enzyme